MVERQTSTVDEVEEVRAVTETSPIDTPSEKSKTVQT